MSRFRDATPIMENDMEMGKSNGSCGYMGFSRVDTNDPAGFPSIS